LSELEITGSLRDVRLVLDGDCRAPCLAGRVYGDAKGRFADGTTIITSTVLEHRPGGVYRTRFSAYRVESWL